MSDNDTAVMQVFDDKDFLLRHKTEAHNMFDLIDFILGRHDHYAFALDIGGGYGDHLPFLMDRIKNVIAIDIINYLDDEQFNPRERASRSEAHGGHLDLSKVDFHYCDAQRLHYRDSLFDLVFSINAFEHIPNPLLALSEAVRVARKGAPIYLQFDPIWNSPWGHHLPHLNFEPWAHLLTSAEEFCALVLELGGTQTDIHIFETAMNRKPFSYYKRLFLEDYKDQFLTSSFASWSTDPHDEPATRHPNFERCRAIGYGVEELVTRGVQFVGVKAW
ncbi:class I SAM-dependent methyltransferase [Methylobacterium thuringiense]|uniref:Methyltransferase type 11 domain-containing protein n=1 Tax=Methylobacterium thuringiense TaxID=1003091 RepID=A0ABQ4TLU9_9HYPH|nr:class I SAM-dependent methyltransferase [Methylobacterium thuringiense]GJE55557.1 hypothetical protein EKPJFOCH_2051 [Methylobacterium thuringiense]